MDVVLLHGFGENPDIWDEFLPLLPKHYNFITLDYSKIAFCQTIDQYAQWVHSEIEEHKITRFVLIGHSMGGYIALAYAEKHAEYLAGLGLFHSTSYPDTEEKKETRDKTVDFIQRKGAEAFIYGFLPNMYNEDFKRKNRVYIRQQLDDNAKLPAEALIQATMAMKQRPDRSSILASLRVPVLFIVGKKDPFVPFEDALKQLPKIAHPYTLILDHAAHAGMREAPQSCAGITTDFLEVCFD
ncbi:alpha/beta hydrolase [Marinilongibacter aquaticus]|uniref:alpha/beta fold hydrolase n=1 Tax=Marinilongibacter aquaticus TaxID=2975157 RepID=UPI0021BD3EC0|nr:alpha/beta hydrolase [Marinilongibacter aquaticus]UBM57185.1 alpha/beta hydrolase [Marinilongibacter aquaticus]